MMQNIEIAKHLYGLRKKVPWVNHQQEEMIAAAARRLEEDARKMAIQDKAIRELQATVKELRYRLDERDGIQRDEAYLAEAAAPGEAAEDFWEDWWPEAGE